MNFVKLKLTTRVRKLHLNYGYKYTQALPYGAGKLQIVTRVAKSIILPELYLPIV